VSEPVVGHYVANPTFLMAVSHEQGFSEATLTGDFHFH
jgi:hypothetical protein